MIVLGKCVFIAHTAFQNVVKRIDFRIAASDVAQRHFNLRDFTAHCRGVTPCMAPAEQETLNSVSDGAGSFVREQFFQPIPVNLPVHWFNTLVLLP